MALSAPGSPPGRHHVGVTQAIRTWHNLSPAELYEHAVRNGEASIVSSGALTAVTGQHTGRSPQDKFFVREPTSQNKIWWYPGNQQIAPEKFDGLLTKMLDYVASHQVYVQDVFGSAGRRTRRRPARSPGGWHSLFANNLFIRPAPDDRRGFEPDF